MSGLTERILVVVIVGLVIAGFIWFRNDDPSPVGPCVQLSGTNRDIPVYYHQDDVTFKTYSSPDCSSESRITI